MTPNICPIVQRLIDDIGTGLSLDLILARLAKIRILASEADETISKLIAEVADLENQLHEKKKQVLAANSHIQLQQKKSAALDAKPEPKTPPAKGKAPRRDRGSRKV